jgi:hypothetical protein
MRYLPQWFEAPTGMAKERQRMSAFSLLVRMTEAALNDASPDPQVIRMTRVSGASVEDFPAALPAYHSYVYAGPKCLGELDSLRRLLEGELVDRIADTDKLLVEAVPALGAPIVELSLFVVSASLTADEFQAALFWRRLGYADDSWFDVYYRCGVPTWGVPCEVVVWPRASAPPGANCNDSATGDSDGDGLIAWWRMEDRVGSAISDASGSGHDLQINGTPTFQPIPHSAGSTLVGDMVVFNNDGTLVAEDSDALDLRRDWTISLWVREDGQNAQNPTNSWIGKVRAYHDSEGGWFFVSDDNSVDMSFLGTPNFSCVSPEPLTLGTWHRLTATYDQATHVIRIYRNETQVHECTGPAVVANAYPVIMGGYMEADASIRPYCQGAIADVRIYDRVLTAPEIAGLAHRL